MAVQNRRLSGSSCSPLNSAAVGDALCNLLNAHADRQVPHQVVPPRGRVRNWLRYGPIEWS
jgi:hypothetical protein